MKKVIIIIFTLLKIGYGQEVIFSFPQLNSNEFSKSLENKNILIIGEWHGTNETPDFVFKLIQALKDQHIKVSLGLEINEEYQNDIDRFIKTGDISIIKKCGFFDKNNFTGGRSSKAMVELIENIRKLKEINVFCFDMNSKKKILTSNDRDSMMATTINKNISNGINILLMGNFHARIKKGHDQNTDIKPVAYLLKNNYGFGNKIISLNTYFRKGTVWNCTDDGGCKIRAIYASPEIEKNYARKNFIVFLNSSLEKTEEFGYDGFIYFEESTASLPLNE
jgi:hypothetical protein